MGRDRWWRAGWLLLCVVACSPGEEEAAKGSPEPPPLPAPLPRIGVVFGERFEGYEEALLTEARRRGRELDLRAGIGSATASESALLTLVDAKVAALLLFPSAPDLLQRARLFAKERQLPLVIALRSDGRSGPWAGASSQALAKEAGERVAARLVADGVKEPRIVVVEDGRWPETVRRADLAIDAIERQLGKVDVRLRQRQGAGTDATLKELLPALDRLKRIDVLIAGDPATTATALAAAERSGLAASVYVVGISDDAATRETAAKSGRAVIACFERDAVARALFDGLDAIAATAPADPSAASWVGAVECKLVGLEPAVVNEPAPAGGR